VSRLAIRPEELARAAGAPEGDAALARDTFLRALRCSPRAFRAHLSSVSLVVWDLRDPPAFIAYLFFTCFAAASLDADLANEGVFRERVRQLLGHDVGTTYALTDLPLLWEQFASWLDEQRSAGKPYRALILPDPGGMTLIGYSVRLAFPRRGDRLRLSNLLATSGFPSSPTVPEVFQLLGSTRGFSHDFRQVFDRAREALVKGLDLPELEAIWSAVLEAGALNRSSERPARVRYWLLAQEDDLGRINPFVVATGTPPGRDGGLRFLRLDESYDDFDHLVCASDGSPESVTKILLAEAREDSVTILGESPVPGALRDGVVLFQPLDSATWELAVTRPNDGRVRALVRSHLATSFMRLFGTSRPGARETQFEGWREIAEFDVTELAYPDGILELASIRCLQRVEVSPQLRLVSGIRVDGGFLGIHGLLPELHCAEATEIAVLKYSDTPVEAPSATFMDLKPGKEHPGVFGWPPEGPDLEGSYLLAATREGRVVASRRVSFHSRALGHDYAGPTYPARWLVEAGTTDMVTAEGTDLFLAQGSVGHTQRPPIEIALAERVQVLTEHSVDDDARHDRLVEILAAISLPRKGIPEVELVRYLAMTIPEASGSAVWGVTRAWAEAGYLDCLTRRHWRGRMYFARKPRIVLIPDDDGVRAVLHGLPPYRLRVAARNTFSRGGARLLHAASLSRLVPAPLSWRLESVDHAVAVTEELGEVDSAWVRDPETVAGDFDLAASGESKLPPGYQLQRVWNWGEGGFRRPKGRAGTDEVQVEYHSRINGPDRYIVVEGDRRLTTLSRTWALLDGFRRAGRRAFSPAGSVVILRTGEDGPQVPLPIARSIALRAGIISGPAQNEEIGRHYAYAVANASEQRWLLAWLSGVAAGGETVRRRFAWLLSLALAPRTDSVPLPTNLRRRLRGLQSTPAALSLADKRLPRYLHPHVLQAANLAEFR